MKVQETYQTWTHHIHSVATWKAICRKHGIHHSKTKSGGPTEHNWNDDLAENLTMCLDKDLTNIFTRVVPELQKSYAELVQRGIEEFPTKLKGACMDITRHMANPLENFMFSMERLQAEIQRDIKTTFELALITARGADRKIPPIVRLAMKPGYELAEAKKGRRHFIKPQTREAWLLILMCRQRLLSGG